MTMTLKSEIEETQDQRLTAHLMDMYPEVSPTLLGELASVSLESSDSFVNARKLSLGHISVAQSMAENLDMRTTAKWQDVLTLMLGTPGYLDVVDSLTVDGKVIVELIAAIYGN